MSHCFLPSAITMILHIRHVCVPLAFSTPSAINKLHFCNANQVSHWFYNSSDDSCYYYGINITIKIMLLVVVLLLKYFSMSSILSESSSIAYNMLIQYRFVTEFTDLLFSSTFSYVKINGSQYL